MRRQLTSEMVFTVKLVVISSIVMEFIPFAYAINGEEIKKFGER